MQVVIVSPSMKKLRRVMIPRYAACFQAAGDEQYKGLLGDGKIEKQLSAYARRLLYKYLGRR